MRGLRHLHLLEGENSEAGEGGDEVGEGGHRAAVQDQLFQLHQPPRLLRQAPQLVILSPSNGISISSVEALKTCSRAGRAPGRGGREWMWLCSAGPAMAMRR